MATYGSTPEKTNEEYHPTYNGSAGARRTDELGNVVQHGRTDTAYGTAHAKTGNEGIVGRPGGPAVLQRSGSSSSSEDDGLGGRRKKGLKEKIKEKLPGGGNKDDQYTHGTQTTTPYGGGTTYTGEGEHHQKRGVMDKVKEKLPGGGNKDDQYSHGTQTATPYGGGTTYAGEAERDQKKGCDGQGKGEA
ncbi:hypothetical protein M2T30_24670, partial [Escherichia coli]|nr:hypothetical protein [Escherichia coli]